MEEIGTIFFIWKKQQQIISYQLTLRLDKVEQYNAHIFNDEKAIKTQNFNN